MDLVIIIVIGTVFGAIGSLLTQWVIKKLNGSRKRK